MSGKRRTAWGGANGSIARPSSSLQALGFDAMSGDSLKSIVMRLYKSVQGSRGFRWTSRLALKATRKCGRVAGAILHMRDITASYNIL